MVEIDGEWEGVAQSPLGTQHSVLSIRSSGSGQFSGTGTGSMGTADLIDGRLDGDHVTFKLKVTKPFPLTLGFDGRVVGDSIEGSIDTGILGRFPMTATRKTDVGQ